jgi:hypothetical protein
MRKVGIGVLTAALLMSGALVGVSHGGSGGITEPTTIELSLDLCGRSCRIFELQDPIHGRPGTAWVTVSDDALLDVDGTRVGRQSYQCTTSGPAGRGPGTPWVCTYVVTLADGPYTDAGTVVTTGIYTFGTDTFAVTGGTGAYENIRGTATMEAVEGREVLTLNLIP